MVRRVTVPAKGEVTGPLIFPCYHHLFSLPLLAEPEEEEEEVLRRVTREVPTGQARAVILSWSLLYRPSM